MFLRLDPGASFQVTVDGTSFEEAPYFAQHRGRIAFTLDWLERIGARRIVEVGGHPWVMTAALVDHGGFEIAATVSIEEEVAWPDDVGVRKREAVLSTPSGRQVSFPAYSVNLERRLASLSEAVDTVVACEVIEHLVRSPHVMLLNFNHWLPRGGKLFVTTPNGAQFSNPLRVRSPYPAYRANCYERHSFLYTLQQLTELVALCGFRIVKAGYVDLYRRRGPSRLYGLLAAMPHAYLHARFRKTLFVVGEKAGDLDSLQRCPSIYDPRGSWELITVSGSQH